MVWLDFLSYISCWGHNFKENRQGTSPFASKALQKASAFKKTLLTWPGSTALLLRLFCAIKITDESDLEAREFP